MHFVQHLQNVKIERNLYMVKKICFLNTLYKYRRNASIWQKVSYVWDKRQNIHECKNRKKFVFGQKNMLSKYIIQIKEKCKHVLATRLICLRYLRVQLKYPSPALIWVRSKDWSALVAFTDDFWQKFKFLWKLNLKTGRKPSFVFILTLQPTLTVFADLSRGFAALPPTHQMYSMCFLQF